MNVLDILKYGDRTLLGSVAGLTEEECGVGGVCGYWSVKDIMAHMLSYELFLGEALGDFVDAGPKPVMQEMSELGDKFNDVFVARYQDKTMAHVVQEYRQAHEHVMKLAAAVDAETYPQNGTIPWYGPEYCLDDFIVYSNYAHKREHSAQVMVYRDKLAKS
jgi:hypothetical protein